METNGSGFVGVFPGSTSSAIPAGRCVVTWAAPLLHLVDLLMCGLSTWSDLVKPRRVFEESLLRFHLAGIACAVSRGGGMWASAKLGFTCKLRIVIGTRLRSLADGLEDAL